MPTDADPRLRRELELVAWALERYGSANDAEDHHAGSWAIDARREAGDTIRAVLARTPRVDALVPGLAAAVASGSIENFTWADHLTAVRTLVRAHVQAERDALAPLAPRREWIGRDGVRLAIDLTARSVRFGTLASISQVARGRFHEDVAAQLGAGALVEVAETAERVAAWQVAHGDAPARSGALPGDLVTEFRGEVTLYLGDEGASLDGFAELDAFLGGALHDEVRAKLGDGVLARALASARLLRGDATPRPPEPAPVRHATTWRRFDVALALGGRLAVLHDRASGALTRATLADLAPGAFADAVRAALGDHVAGEAARVAAVRLGQADCRCDKLFLSDEDHGLMEVHDRKTMPDVPVEIVTTLGRCRGCCRLWEITVEETGNGRYRSARRELTSPPEAAPVFAVTLTAGDPAARGLSKILKALGAEVAGLPAVIARGLSEAEARRLCTRIKGAGGAAHFDVA